MKASLSLLLIPPPPELPPVPSSHSLGEESLPGMSVVNNSSWACSPAPSCSASRRTYTPRRRSNLSGDMSRSRLGDNSPSLSHLSDTGSYGDSPCTEADASGNSTFSVLSVSAASGRMSSPFSSSRCSTPLDQSRNTRSDGNLSRGNNASALLGLTPAGPETPCSSASKSGTKKLGSTVKYAIGSTTPLLK